MPDTATLAVATAQTATGADVVGNLSAVAAGTTAPTSTHAGTGGSNSVSAPAATLVKPQQLRSANRALECVGLHDELPALGTVVTPGRGA